MRATTRATFALTLISPFLGQTLLGQINVLPYSAVQITESVQTLSDGTHITQGKQTTLLYRDSQGRTRTEPLPTPILGATLPNPPLRFIIINDPVAGSNYTLNPNAKTGQRMQMPGRVAPGAMGSAGTGFQGAKIMMTPTGPGILSSTVAALPVPPPTAKSPLSKSEELGTQLIEGLLCEGRRTITVYPIGMFGNDREITAIYENWTVKELGIPVLSKAYDPRMGESVTKLTEINRAAPDPDLFMIPADYTIEDQPAQGQKK